MTKMANRINKYQSRLVIWKMASNAWFTTAISKIASISHCKTRRKSLEIQNLYCQKPKLDVIKVKSRGLSQQAHKVA
jgi:hypothetical protein